MNALVAEKGSGKSVRQLARDAGIPHSRLAYYLKPGSKVRTIPAPDVLTDIARAIGASDHEVLKAFCDDLGYRMDED